MFQVMKNTTPHSKQVDVGVKGKTFNDTLPGEILVKLMLDASCMIFG